MHVRLLGGLALLAAVVSAIAAAPSFAANPINVQISPASQTVATTARGCVTVKATDSVTGQPVVADFQLAFHFGPVQSRLEQTVPVRTDGAGNGSACVNAPDRTPTTATVTLYENGIVVYAGTASGSTGTSNSATIHWSNVTAPTTPPGLALSAEASQASVVAGAEVTLVLDLSNAGTELLLTEVSLATTIPSGAEVVSATFDGGACDGAANCTAGGIDPGAHNKATIVIRAAAAGKLAFAFSARARMTVALSGQSGFQTRTASVSVDVLQRVADVGVKLTAPAVKLVVGKVVRTTAVVRNRGRNDAPLTTFQLTVPVGLELVGLTSAQGRCSAATRRCTFDAIAPAATVRILISLKPAKPARLILVVRAASPQASDPAAGDNVARLTLKPAAPK